MGFSIWIEYAYRGIGFNFRIYLIFNIYFSNLKDRCDCEKPSDTRDFVDFRIIGGILLNFPITSL